MFQHAVRVILATSGQHKAEVIAEQWRQARASIERILENGRATR